ncbi:MAG: hypothetical protein U0599_07325 [Vicinamibacteria bacterium]
MSLLDAAVPMPGPAVAAVCDSRGLAACRPLKPSIRPTSAPRSPRAGRSAPGRSRSRRRASPSPSSWSNDTGSLPDVRRLPGLWPKAGAWLATVRTGERRAAVAAVDALPDDAARCGSWPATPARRTRPRGSSSCARRSRGDDAKAVALFRARLAELRGGNGLSFAPVQVSSSSEGEEAEGDFEAPDAEGEGETPAADPLVTGLRAWLEPFRDAKKTALVAAAASEALPVTGGAARPSPAAWALAVDLAPSAEARAAALARVERAWRLGDLSPSLAPVAESAADVAGRSVALAGAARHRRRLRRRNRARPAPLADRPQGRRGGVPRAASSRA